MGKIEILISLSLLTVAYGQFQQQGFQPQQQQQPARTGFGAPQTANGQQQFGAVQRQNQQRPAFGGPQGAAGPQGNGPQGFNNRGPNGGQQNQGRLGVNQQSQLQLQLSGQPSLVNIGGCSRGVSLRNSDGSTLVCGFGPRDFECPPGFSCTFDNGLKALVCCPNENNTRPAPEKEDDQPNPCPDHEPIKDEFGHRLKCDFASGPSQTCPTGTLCVVGACCPVSVAGLISVKPGKCPLPLPVSPGQNCQNDCTFDADCPGPAKCCFVGCGARCVASVAPETPAPSSSGGPNGAGPLSGNGASLTQFNLQRGGNGPRGPIGQNQNQQQQNPFFNQQSQQFQFPNNGPPGTLRNGPPGVAPQAQQQQQRNGGFGAQQQTSAGQQQQFRPQQQGQQQQQQFQNGNGFGSNNNQNNQQNINRNRQFDQALDE